MPTAFPPTGQFPSEPRSLEREELDAAYLELRKSYRGLMQSRGQYRGKAERNRAAMQRLEEKLREIANREASVRQEAYEMLEIVTNVVGDWKTQAMHSSMNLGPIRWAGGPTKEAASLDA